MRRLLELTRDLVVALVVIGACVGLFRFGVMRLVESLAPFDSPFVTFVRRFGVVGSALFGYFVLARYFERRRPDELRLRPAATIVSAFAGVIVVAIPILLLLALGYYRIISIRDGFEWLGIVGAIMTAAVLEEVVFRGALFRLIENRFGTVRALVAQAGLFGVLHLFNEGTTPLTIVSVTLLGALWALVFVYTRSLWAAILNHFAWNVTIFLSGLPLSGQEAWRSASPLETESLGPVWITGGAFGPEDSIITIVLLLGVVGRLGHAAWSRVNHRIQRRVD